MPSTLPECAAICVGSWSPCKGRTGRRGGSRGSRTGAGRRTPRRVLRSVGLDLPEFRGMAPFAEQGAADREQGRADENAQQSEGDDPAEHAEEHEQQRQRTAEADKVGSDHVVDSTDDEKNPQAEQDPRLYVDR